MYTPRPNPLPQLTPDRIRHLIGRIEATIWSRRDALTPEASDATTDILRPSDLPPMTWTPVARGASFGKPGNDWRQHWFRLTIPAAAPGEEGKRHLYWACNGETTVHVDGSAWTGLDCAHATCLLPDKACELLLETCLWQTGIWAVQPPITSTGCRFECAELRVRDEAAHALWVDLRVLSQLMDHLMGYHQRGNLWDSGRHQRRESLVKAHPVARYLIEHLGRAVDAYDRDGVAACAEKVAEVSAHLKGTPWAGRAELIGHSHLDLVWLWPEAATRRKNVHTSATMAGLMDRYPELTFFYSQSWLMERLGEDDPALRERMLAHVRRGACELDGLFTVESDVMVTGGETLVRCLRKGQRQAVAVRGEPGRILWIPDVFGYSGCLPQLIRLAGGTYFYTCKMSWNRITPFPYTSFHWEGNDGTSVLTHIPQISYNGNVDIGSLVMGMEDHRQAGVHDGVLFPIGFGDGAGGVTEDQVERARRLRSLAGVPEASWTTARAFFGELEKEAAHLPRMRGTLYPEYHRGTPTSQSEMKRNFRAAERGMQAWEAARCLAGMPALPDGEWERLFLASFHDAIPGSSIREVYEELVPQLAARAESAVDAARDVLGGAGDVLFNPMPVRQTGIVTLPDGRTECVSLPGLSATPLEEARVELSAPVWQDGILSNEHVFARFDAEGRLAALAFDGEPIPLTDAPGLMLHADHPPEHDAWEVELYDLRQGTMLPLGVLAVREQSELRIELEQAFRVDAGAEGVLVWSLDAGASGLSVRVEMDWRARHQWLRFVVPTGYQGRMARFGGPYGSALRPQLAGYEQDTAQWEGAGSRWAAVMDETGRQGLAFVTEAKYGFAALDGALSVSLLRGPTSPDPECDIGRHAIRFQLRPWRSEVIGDVPSTALAAETVYAPVLAVAEAKPSLAFWTEPGSLVPSWVEPATRGEGIVLRAHEAVGAAGVAVLELDASLGAPEAVNLLEEPLEGIEIRDLAGNRYEVVYAPYAILSLRCPKATFS